MAPPEKQIQFHLNSTNKALIANQCFLGRSKPHLDKISIEFFDLMRTREQRYALEDQSAQIIQKMFRGKGARKALRMLKAAVIQIQNALRNFIIHRRELARVKKEEKRARVTLYDGSALLIQKVWRGYKSRKRHPHLTQSVRKEYFDRIKSKELEVKKLIEHDLENVKTFRKAAKAAEQSARFEHKIGSMHHLIGTASSPGIYTKRPSSAAGKQINDEVLRSSKAIKERIRSATAKLRTPLTPARNCDSRPKSVTGMVGKIRPISAAPSKMRPKSAFQKTSTSKLIDF